MSEVHLHHSLEDNTDYTAVPANQGIVNGEPEGRQPEAAPLTLDSVIDPDASTDDDTLQHPPASSTLTGATSATVHGGLGVPAQGMSSKELRHDGQPGRKRHGEGVEQFGEGAGGDMGRGSGTRRVDNASERRWVAGKTEFHGES